MDYLWRLEVVEEEVGNEMIWGGGFRGTEKGIGKESRRSPMKK